MALPRYIVHKVGWVGGNPIAHKLRIAEWQYCHRDQVKFADR